MHKMAVGRRWIALGLQVRKQVVVALEASFEEVPAWKQAGEDPLDTGHHFGGLAVLELGMGLVAAVDPGEGRERVRHIVMARAAHAAGVRPLVP